MNGWIYKWSWLLSLDSELYDLRQHKTSNITVSVTKMQCSPGPQNLLDEACCVYAPDLGTLALSTLSTSSLRVAWTCSLGRLPRWARHVLLPPSLQRESSFNLDKYYHPCTADSIWLSCPLSLAMFSPSWLLQSESKQIKGGGTWGCVFALIRAKVMKRMESFVNMSQEANTEQNCKTGIENSTYLNFNVMRLNHPFKFGIPEFFMHLYNTFRTPF